MNKILSKIIRGADVPPTGYVSIDINRLLLMWDWRFRIYQHRGEFRLVRVKVYRGKETSGVQFKVNIDVGTARSALDILMKEKGVKFHQSHIFSSSGAWKSNRKIKKPEPTTKNYFGKP